VYTNSDLFALNDTSSKRNIFFPNKREINKSLNSYPLTSEGRATE